VELFRVELTGAPVRADSATAGWSAELPGVLGVDVAARVLDGTEWTVVQVLLDDDHPGFDHALLDGPLVAELIGADGDVIAREPFDHDRFRRQLRDERHAGESSARGVLVTTNGELPPPWIRLAFLPVEIGATAGASLLARRTSVAALRLAVDDAHGRGEITDAERRAVLLSIEQRHGSLEQPGT
jgi:hypothetical protein